VKRNFSDRNLLPGATGAGLSLRRDGGHFGEGASLPAGSAKRFRPELYRSYVRVLARNCLRDFRYLEPKLDASDLAQDDMLQAHVAVDQFHGSTEEEFKAWLRRILKNKVLDAAKHYRQKKCDAKLEEALDRSLNDWSTGFDGRLAKALAADQTSPTQFLVRNERAYLLADALESLLEDQYTAIELHHLSGLSLKETSQSMNREVASVAGLLARGLRELRRYLREQKETLR